MAKRSQSLASMSVEALLKLRDDIGGVLSKKAADLQKQLARLAGDGRSMVGRGKRAKSSLKGRKVAPKYRDKAGNSWAGRGARPRWLVAALKDGAKLEDFAVAKTAASRKKLAGKRSRAT